MSLIDTLLRAVIQDRARHTSLKEIRVQLNTSAYTVVSRLEKAEDTLENRERARHIVGIERWGARRLRVILGESPVQDEYDGYRPPESLSLPDLVASFRGARSETLGLVDLLHPFADRQALHNQLGPLSVAAWMIYLDNHARMESRWLRPR